MWAKLEYLGLFANGWQLKTNLDYQTADVVSFSHAPVSVSSAGILTRRQQQFTPETDRYLANTPTDTANLWLTYEFTDSFLKGLGLGGGASYVGQRYVDSNNTFELPGHTLFDATAFYYLPLNSKSQLRFQLGVKNLTDEKYYIPNSNIRTIGVGQPRIFFASVGFEFE